MGGERERIFRQLGAMSEDIAQAYCWKVQEVSAITDVIELGTYSVTGRRWSQISTFNRHCAKVQGFHRAANVVLGKMRGWCVDSDAVDDLLGHHCSWICCGLAHLRAVKVEPPMASTVPAALLEEIEKSHFCKTYFILLKNSNYKQD